MKRCDLFAGLMALRPVAAILLFSAAVFAQSDVGTIVGFAKDPSGAVVPNAQITVRNEATHEEHKVETDAQGHYTVPNLLPGYYGLTADARGFKKFQSTNNKLDANTTIDIDANLTVGEAT